ncbi:Crp/Fnr family transcriptional regulator [Pseudoprevotella muciniphila]|uniref:Crp/Fnr family transcriptional regulator n=1 Tax=Pseudoprevotella muciniphila TaxID=2133944 RepID=A0A5P8E4D9_9BACT|nr:Crp/Fnr family transcriptional regulator [Pseudoprevotella muciniphila]QFQ11889.1 Crp/Fnr family transcriptional regulator [Pseudoprevotella muciniphila]
MIDFNSYIDGLDLSALKEYCVNHGRLTQYAKGDYFIKAGEESRYIGFVECGYFNYIVHNSSEQKDYITGFAFEREFVGDYPNCLSNKTSEVTIVAGTSCKVFQLAGEELGKLLDSNGMRELKQAISDHLFSQVYTQYLDTYRMTTRERYKRLLLRCPEIVQSINLKNIASYLKVTPTTISYIRREITFGL